MTCRRFLPKDEHVSTREFLKLSRTCVRNIRRVRTFYTRQMQANASFPFLSFPVLFFFFFLFRVGCLIGSARASHYACSEASRAVLNLDKLLTRSCNCGFLQYVMNT